MLDYLDYRSLEVVLKSGHSSLPILFFYSKVVWVILNSLHFHMNFRMSLSISTKKKLFGFLFELHWIYRWILGENDILIFNLPTY